MGVFLHTAENQHKSTLNNLKSHLVIEFLAQYGIYILQKNTYFCDLQVNRHLDFQKGGVVEYREMIVRLKTTEMTKHFK